MPRQETGAAEGLIEAVFRLTWGFRVEIALGGGVVGIGAAACDHLRSPWGALLPVTLIAVTLIVPPLRGLLGRVVRRGRVRRQWHRGVRLARITAFEERSPLIVGIESVPAGERLDLRVPLGSCVADLETAAEVIAATLGVREVRVRRDAANASRAEVVIVRRDPLATGSLPWPKGDAGPLSLWEPIPVGVGEDGQVVDLSLSERNLLLVGGEPGAGQIGCPLPAGGSGRPGPHGSPLAPRREARRAGHLGGLRRAQRGRERR